MDRGAGIGEQTVADSRFGSVRSAKPQGFGVGHLRYTLGIYEGRNLDPARLLAFLRGGDEERAFWRRTLEALERFGVRPAEWHSQLSQRLRARTWNAVATGELMLLHVRQGEKTGSAPFPPAIQTAGQKRNRAAPGPKGRPG